MEELYHLFEGIYCRFHSQAVRKNAQLVLEEGGTTLCRNVGI